MMAMLSCTPNVMRHFRYHQGISLVELIISITLSLLVLLFAMSLIFSIKSSFLTQFDSTDTHETARFAIDNISRSIRQAGYINFDFNNSLQVVPSTSSADISGLDANSLSATSSDLSSPLGISVNYSDVLAIRYFGSGVSASGDGTITNCAGFSVPGPTSSGTASQDRGWSIYYVAYNLNKEPELFCKYQSVNSKNGSMSWNAQAIVKGVESFQVLYGVDTSSPFTGHATKFLNASTINALDAGLSLVGDSDAEKKLTSIGKHSGRK